MRADLDDLAVAIERYAAMKVEASRLAGGSVWRTAVVAIVRHVAIFVVTAVGLWGLGVDPVTSARVAMAPVVLMTACSAMGMAIVWMGVAVVKLTLSVQTDTAIREAIARRGYTDDDIVALRARLERAP